MSRSKSLSWSPRPTTFGVREGAAAVLRAASVVLARLSRRLSRPRVGSARRAVPADARLEFYAEAGAPEGALYLDGELVGWVAGVTRL